MPSSAVLVLPVVSRRPTAARPRAIAALAGQLGAVSGKGRTFQNNQQPAHRVDANHTWVRRTKKLAVSLPSLEGIKQRLGSALRARFCSSWHSRPGRLSRTHTASDPVKSNINR